MYSLASTVFIEIWRNAWVGQVREYSLSLFLSPFLSVLPSFSSRSTHTHSVPRERNSRSTVIKILRASAERYSARNRVNMRETFFFLFIIPSHLMRYNLVRDRTASWGGYSFILFLSFWPTDGMANEIFRFDSIALVRLINYCHGSFVHRKKGNLFVRKKRNIIEKKINLLNRLILVLRSNLIIIVQLRDF